MQTFKYRKSLPVSEWGCHFDSMLEFKYALSIHEEYDFLRSHVSVYYDPKTRKLVDYMRYNTKRYTPDFLIRNKETFQAFWIEIKPRVFENQQQLIIRTGLAENYIKWKGFDWKFKVIYDDQINLSQQMQLVYNSYYKYKSRCVEGHIDQAEIPELSIVKFSPDPKRIHFVMFGNSSV